MKWSWLAVALAAVVAAPAHAETSAVVVGIDGMTCSGCQERVTGALEGLAFVDSVVASFAVGGACATLNGTLDDGSIRQAIEGLDYAVTAIEAVAQCPANLRKGSRVDAWDDTEGLDVAIISRGETVDLKANLAVGKYTVVDFGAPWCGPCHAVAATLKEYLRAHADTVVRVVTLDAADATASYALPVVEQHLKWAAGVPYFIVYDGAGKSIYKGSEIDAAIRAIDKRRAKR